MFNLEDCFNHMIYSSDPVVRKEASKVAEEKEENQKEGQKTKKEPNEVEKYDDDYVFENLLAKEEDEIEE